VNRQVLLLAFGWAIAQTVNVVLITGASVLGRDLVSDKTLATLPVAAQHTSTMLATIPASFLMRRIGRRGGFLVGTLLGLCGATIGLVAAATRSFPLVNLGSAFLGSYVGFSLFYRFTAADTADDKSRAKAISLVMAGGVVAGLMGPSLAAASKDLVPGVPFAGYYGALIALLFLAIGSLAFLHVPPSPKVETPTRSLREIARQPIFLVAVFGGMIAYGCMAFVMTATPLAMMGCCHSFADAARVVQWHTVAMFAPSFVTGHLIARYGILGVMFTGAALMLGCVGTSVMGTSFELFFVALVLLGIGWNFLFVGATTLLTLTYRPSERAKVQAANDFVVFGTVALAAFLSGPTLERGGWSRVTLAIVPFTVLSLGTILWLARSRESRAVLSGPS
jgi:MFS family permease